MLSGPADDKRSGPRWSPWWSWWLPSPPIWPRNSGNGWDTPTPSSTGPTGPPSTPEKAAEETVKIAVQVNGKLRGTVETPAGTGQDEVEALARAQDDVTRHLDGTDRSPDRLCTRSLAEFRRGMMNLPPMPRRTVTGGRRGAFRPGRPPSYSEPIEHAIPPRTRPGPAPRRRHPSPFHGRHPESQLRTPRSSHGPGSPGVRGLDSAPSA